MPCAVQRDCRRIHAVHIEEYFAGTNAAREQWIYMGRERDIGSVLRGICAGHQAQCSDIRELELADKPGGEAIGE